MLLWENGEIEVYKFDGIDGGYLVIEVEDEYELFLTEEEILNAYPEFGF